MIPQFLLAVSNHSRIRCYVYLIIHVTYQIPNISKTMFCHFAKEPLLDPIYITDDTMILSIDIDKGHHYLGMIFTPTGEGTTKGRSNFEVSVWLTRCRCLSESSYIFKYIYPLCSLRHLIR